MIASTRIHNSGICIIVIKLILNSAVFNHCCEEGFQKIHIVVDLMNLLEKIINMDIKFIGTPVENVECEVQTLLKRSENVSIAVAFLKNSGIELIKKGIEESKNNGTKISIVTGLDFGITDSESLRELLDMGVNCNVVNDINFHPKMYIFETGEDNATMIVGSSNLSKGGLSTNYEANIIVTGKVSESPIKDAIEYFSQIQLRSVQIDEKIIDLYAKSKVTIDLINKSVNEDEKHKDARKQLSAYLQNESTFEELNETNIDELMESADDKQKCADDLFESGKINESFPLYEESYKIYDKLLNISDNRNDEIIHGKINCLLGLARLCCELYKFADARKYTDEAEKLAEKLCKTTDDVGYILNVLCWSVCSRLETNEINEICDKFIKIYESKGDKSEYDNYNAIGSIYLSSAQKKFELNPRNTKAVKHIYNAIEYLRKDLEVSTSDYSRMASYLLMAGAHQTQNNIEKKVGGNEIKINKYFKSAQDIAKEILESKFWEGVIRMRIVQSYVTKQRKCSELKISRKIFHELEYDTIVSRIDELKQFYMCK